MNLRDETAANIIRDIIYQFLEGGFVEVKVYRELEYGDVIIEAKQSSPKKTEDISITIEGEHTV